MAREHPMFEYSGPEDPTRLDEVDLSDDELKAEVRWLTKLSKKDRIQLDPLRQPFDADHQPDEICADIFMQCILAFLLMILPVTPLTIFVLSCRTLR